MKKRIGESLRRVRTSGPLVQCITNIVTVNDCANIILAAGGSATMCMDIREVEETVSGVQALVCNMGAIDYIPSMLLAGKRANELGIPVLLDPVAVGRSGLRRESVKTLLEHLRFSAIRGNATEMRHLAGCHGHGSGVDVSGEDAVGDKNLRENIELMEELGRKTGAVVTLSGAVDIISDGKETVLLRNGCATMSRITGSGCMLTSLMGAFAGAWPEDSFAAVCAAAACMGVAGELAEKRRLERGEGNAGFRTYLVDAVFNMTEEMLMEAMKLEIYKG